MFSLYLLLFLAISTLMRVPHTWRPSMSLTASSASRKSSNSMNAKPEITNHIIKPTLLSMNVINLNQISIPNYVSYTPKTGNGPGDIICIINFVQKSQFGFTTMSIYQISIVGKAINREIIAYQVDFSPPTHS